MIPAAPTAGQAAAGAPDAAQVTTLARCYNEVAEVAPRLDVVPLTPSADWSPGKPLKLRPAAFQGSDFEVIMLCGAPGSGGWGKLQPCVYS